MNSHFSLLSTEFLPTLGITLESYKHNRTGAKHFHFASENDENVFMVALRTMPHDSTGVAHILEHTALCGSKNFNVRDPFFSMLRRSMQTFMNAFTSSDWTAYPFATQNKQDFHNLLQVYLDAVFFPNLNRLDFLQEWHRFDFDDNENLVLKGVVYNEMKGVYGNPISRLYEINKSLLHPETTYHYDSGWYPQVIPHLTYENFIAFHKKHYHPTNATFFTFGNIPAAEHQENFENLALKFFPSHGEKVTTDDETRLLSRTRTTVGYPSSDHDNPNQTHIILSWLLGATNNAKNFLEQKIIFSYLLGHSGSPLRYALENVDFSAALSPLTMLDDSGRELRFSTGIITDNAHHADATEKLVFEILEKIVTDGIPTQEANGIIDKIEMSLRELETGYPYGLSLMLQAIGAATHEENLSLMLDPSELLEEMRENIKNPHYLGELIRKNLLENPHFTRLTAVPDAHAVEQEQALEKMYCEKVQNSLSLEEKENIKKDIENLNARQKMTDDVSVLPKILLKDIPTHTKEAPSRKEISPNHSAYEVPTNRLGYIQSYFPLSHFSRDEIWNLSLASELFGSLGFGENTFVEAQKKISGKINISGGFQIFKKFGEENLHATFSSKCRFLLRNIDEAKTLYNKITHTPRFDEISQIRNIFNEKLLLLKNELTDSGNVSAMARASHGHTLSANISEQINSIASLQNLHNFIKKSDEEIVKNLETVYQKAIKNPKIVVTIGENIDYPNENNEKNIFEKVIDEDFTPFQTQEAWLTDLAVGYCAASIKCIPAHHADAPLLMLLGQFLRDGYLHSAIREQGGAYGSGAGYDASSESFRFFSYRDPRIEGTFADFENSLKWLLENNHDTERLDEAKIGVIAKMDTPSSPAKEASVDAFNNLLGFDANKKNERRKIILEATIDDLKRITKTYLNDFSRASRVVITGKQNKEIVEKMWLEIKYFDEK